MGEGGDRRALSIPARLERLAEVREFIDHAASAAGFEEAERYEVKLALNEAVTNAIRHGSESPDDRVEILVSEHDGQLDLSVADSGVFVHRFELRRQLAEGGRGLAFIAELMDGLEVCPEYEGTTIRFSKRSASP
jgi:serine/threonine-protein kinase RsbW